MKKALILVDIQNDFCPGGNLAVRDGDKIIPLVNELMNSGEYSYIVATLDWHPSNHSSFVTNNPESGIWPNHCIQFSKGSELNSQLNSNKIEDFVYKGINHEIDSYSGFFDNDHKSKTNLDDLLKAKGILAVDVVGLALDYCVKATAIDAKNLGYKTKVILNATRAVNIKSTDGENAVFELKSNGIELE